VIHRISAEEFDLRRKGKTLGAEPKPDLTDRARFSKLFEDAVNGLGDALIRMEEDLAILFSPEKANRKAPAQLSRAALLRMPPSSRAQMTCSQPRHGSFQSEKEPIG